MDEFKIRLATVVDIPVLVHQRRSMFQDMGRLTPAEEADIVERFTPYLPKSLAAGDYRGYLVETASGEVVAGGGLLIYNRLGRPRAYICNIYTDPNYRRRGLARRVMETIIAWCRAEGFSLIDLHASEFGRPIYAALGFEPTSEMRLKFS